jgi:uncharacterized phage protein gp47/JayE
VARVIADANAGLAYLVLLYIDWLALQFLPDTAETEWLDRHAQIWIPPGRKQATFASGTVTVTGLAGTILPSGSQLSGGAGEVNYETTEQITVGADATPVDIRAIDAGKAGNAEEATQLSFITAIPGVDGQATVVILTGGSDTETDEQLRLRVLRRIQQPPMGGAAYDYEAWALEVPGVTRAWCAPQEMGIGTATVRFMCDDLRADNGGFPYSEDIDAVQEHLDEKRPVTVKEMWVVAPIPQPISFTITELVNDNEATRAAIETSVKEMLLDVAAPGQTIYRSWISEAVSRAVGEVHHDLDFEDTPALSNGHLAVLGSIYYG